MQYIIGIDGGGTKTKLTVCTIQGEVIHSVIAGPSNILSSGYEAARESIQTVIHEGTGKKGYPLEDCVALCIGVAGAGRDTVKAQLETIIRETGYANALIVTHDAETALMGGTEGDEGILMIAGTGAICYGRNKEGMRHRVSGWGHIIGDEGSAYSIGIKIVNAVMKAYDGRGKKTWLTPLLLQQMQLEHEEQIIGHIYSPEVTKQHIASYAVLIDEACANCDEVAFKIIQETVEALYECVSAGLKKLGFEDKEIKVIINGSVLVNNQYVNKGFKERIALHYPKVRVGTMEQDAAYGAALLAWELL